MKKAIGIIIFTFTGFIFCSCATSTKGKETAPAQEVSSQNETVVKNENLVNKESLEKRTVIEELSISPRHHEWVTLNNGSGEFEAFVVYPESNKPTKSIIVIHENRGLNDWARLFADKLAASGYLVIAPDMISNTQGKKRTTDFENPDAARDAIYALDPEQVTANLDAAYKYIKNDPSSTGEVAVVGFCWGGSQTFRYATNNQEISSAHVFYGTAPDDAEALALISAPVYGYYGGDDNRVNSTIDRTEEQMQAAGNLFQYEIYPGAGHAFMARAHQPEPSPANQKAHDEAWQRLLNLVKN